MKFICNTDTIWTLVQVEDNDSFQNELSRQLVQSINLGSPMQDQQPNVLNPFSASQQNQPSNQVNKIYYFNKILNF